MEKEIRLRKVINFTRPRWFKKFRYFLLGNREINICNFYDYLSLVYGDRTAVALSEGVLPYSFTGKKTISHKEIYKFIGKLSKILEDRGVGKGDRVIIYLRNRIEIFLSFLAILRKGAVAIPVNPLFKKMELEFITKDSQAKALITDKGSVEYIGGKDNLPDCEILFTFDEKIGEGIFLNEEIEEATLSNAYPLDLKKEGKDAVAILYTSGTTGFPKGAILSAKALSYVVKRALRLSVFFPHINSSLGINAQPLSHVMGIDLMLISCIGAIPQIFVPKFDAKVVLDLIERERVTHFVGVPTMYKMMWREGAEKKDLKSIWVYGSAADYIPPDLLEKFREVSKRKILGIFNMKPFALEEYGQVETSGFIAFRISIPFVRYDRANLFLRAPHVKIKLFDEKGKPIRFWQIGEIGEVCVKGKTVMEGYFSKGRFLKDNFYGEWLRTGDMAEKRPVGFKLVGREKDRIKVGGYSVFPPEVEEEIRKHPDVEDVIVFSVPHEIKGELPLAAIKLRRGGNCTEDSLFKWIKENIAPYKAPRKIFIMDDFPRNLTMKVLRKELQKKYEYVASEI